MLSAQPPTPKPILAPVGFYERVDAGIEQATKCLVAAAEAQYDYSTRQTLQRLRAKDPAP